MYVSTFVKFVGHDHNEGANEYGERCVKCVDEYVVAIEASNEYIEGVDEYVTALECDS